MNQKPSKKGTMSECACGAMSYVGGWCFKCGKYRPSKRVPFAEEQDLSEHCLTVLGLRLAQFGWPPNDWNK